MLAVTALSTLAGAVMLIELSYRHSLATTDGSVLQLFGANLDATSPSSWLLALGLLSAGVIAFRRLLPNFRQRCETLGYGSEEGA